MGQTVVDAVICLALPQGRRHLMVFLTLQHVSTQHSQFSEPFIPVVWHSDSLLQHFWLHQLFCRLLLFPCHRSHSNISVCAVWQGPCQDVKLCILTECSKINKLCFIKSYVLLLDPAPSKYSPKHISWLLLGHIGYILYLLSSLTPFLPYQAQHNPSQAISYLTLVIYGHIGQEETGGRSWKRGWHVSYKGEMSATVKEGGSSN